MTLFRRNRKPETIWDRHSRPHVQLFRLLGKHLVAGLACAWVLAGCILFFDFRGIGSMIWRSPDAWVWVFILVFSLSVTFGSVAMGIGIMSLGQERD